MITIKCAASTVNIDEALLKLDTVRDILDSSVIQQMFGIGERKA